MVCHHSVEQRKKFKGKEQLASHAREYVAKWKVEGERRERTQEVRGRGTPKRGGEGGELRGPKKGEKNPRRGREEPKKGEPKKDPKDKRQKTKFGPASWSGLCTDGDRRRRSKRWRVTRLE